MCLVAFDGILLNEADGAADAGNYGNVWVLNEDFSESLGLRLTIGKRHPRDNYAGFH